MKEDKESPGTKIFIQVVGAVLTAVVLYFIGINTSGERAKAPEKEKGIEIPETKEEKPIPATAEKINQNRNLGNRTKPSTDTKISFPEHVKEGEPAKVEAESKLRYSSEIKDASGNGIPGVEIYCPNCIVKKVKTDKEGYFSLEGYFAKDAAFWQSTITLSKDKKSKTETIDWREKSPQPINL